MHYNIPRKIRELQFPLLTVIILFIITYQEKLGNYNVLEAIHSACNIITYQEKLGNYNQKVCDIITDVIITYQEKLGNYNLYII